MNVEKGEALFEVAKDANRLFVVRAADQEVVALGTVFSVRLTPTQEVRGDALAVTLNEGKVSVSTVRRVIETEVARPILLKPGDRLRLTESGDKAMQGTQRVSMQLDRPNVDRLMAWRRSEAIFDDVTLSEAVAEMNRYSRKVIVLVGEESSNNLHVSGLFRTGDNVAFARAVAALHKPGRARSRPTPGACAWLASAEEFAEYTVRHDRAHLRDYGLAGGSFE